MLFPLIQITLNGVKSKGKSELGRNMQSKKGSHTQGSLNKEDSQRKMQNTEAMTQAIMQAVTEAIKTLVQAMAEAAGPE